MSANQNTKPGSQIIGEANAFGSAVGMRGAIEGMLRGANTMRSRTIDVTRGAGAFANLKFPNGKALGAASQGDLVRYGEQLGIPVSHENGHAVNIALWHDWLTALAMQAVEEKFAQVIAEKGGV